MSENPDTRDEGLYAYAEENVEKSDKILYGALESEYEDESETENSNEIKEPFKLGIYPADTKLQDYERDWDRGYLNIPEFQRKYVWNKREAGKFIESILLGLPVPNIFLYQDAENSQNIVIDGHQRIITIVSFIKGKFIRGENFGKPFDIKGETGLWDKLTYDELDEDTKFKFNNYIMRATVIEQRSPDNDSSIYHIFERLNTGGKTLRTMEVRMCMGLGKFTRLLSDLNELEKWRKLLGKDKIDPRFRDIEYILRFFVLQELGQEYSSPMIKLLTKYILVNKNKDSKWIEEKRKIFEEALDKALILEDKPFHINQVFNLSAFDSIMVALANSNISDEESLKSSYKKLLENEKYMEIVQQGRSTTNTKIVKERLEIAEEAFGNV